VTAIRLLVVAVAALLGSCAARPTATVDPDAMCLRCHDLASRGECKRKGYCLSGAGDCEAAGCAIVRSPPLPCAQVQLYCIPAPS
jgi:hypothetical protein